MQDLWGFTSHNPLITRSRLEACEKEFFNFSPSRPRDLGCSDVELEEKESEQTSLAFSLPLYPERANSPVEFAHDFLFPSPRARDTVSFRLDDILHTAASDSEDCGPALADALLPSGQEARPSAAHSELVDVLLRHQKARAGLARWAPWVPSFETRWAVPQRWTFQAWKEEAAIVQWSPDPGSSHFPLALLMRRPLTSPTSWVLWSRVTPPYRWSRILWPPIFHPLWRLPGSPAPSFLPSRVGPIPLLSGSPTSRPVRQVWPSTRWPSFRPTRRTSWRRWMKGPAWLQKPWRNYAEPLTWLWEPPSTPHTPWGALWRLRWPQNAICGSI